jgi:hypothetical protein
MTDVPFLVAPPPQLFSSTYQMVEVASRLEQNDVQGARTVLYSIDLDACTWYWKESGRSGLARHDTAYHRDRKPRAKGFKFTTRLKREIGDRDGWRCRYCSLPVADSYFLKTVKQALPEEFPAAPAPIEGSAYPMRRLFRMTPDHVVPRSAGGADDMSNLVASCGACNFQAKGDCSLEELGLGDPFGRDPVRDGWNGLQRRPR